jgi:hypothetical protein
MSSSILMQEQRSNSKTGWMPELHTAAKLLKLRPIGSCRSSIRCKGGGIVFCLPALHFGAFVARGGGLKGMAIGDASGGRAGFWVTLAGACIAMSLLRPEADERERKRTWPWTTHESRSRTPLSGRGPYQITHRASWPLRPRLCPSRRVRPPPPTRRPPARWCGLNRKGAAWFAVVHPSFGRSLQTRPN